MKILLKLTGNILDKGPGPLENIAAQIKQLDHTFGIVIGGGNFFRGARQSSALHISEQTGHTVGMLATMMNGLIVQDILEQAGVSTTLFSAVSCPSVGLPLSPQALNKALKESRCLIFSGGTGNPFVSTDTTAVIRALQMDAQQIWKATKVDGVYSADPQKEPSAKLIKKLTYKQALDDNLDVMDATAFTLAQEHNLDLRVFNIFSNNALIQAANDPEFGSTLSTKTKG